MKTSQCRSCGAEIIWTITGSGRRMPVDAEPQRRIVLLEAASPEPIAQVMETYVSHFATCPNADEHRRT